MRKLSSKGRQLFVGYLYKSNNLHIHNLATRIIWIYRRFKTSGITIKKIDVQSVEVDVKPEIPCLSWLGELQNDEWHFICGNKVEFNDSNIIEGAWDGNFDEWNFKNSEFVFGSGVSIANGELRFIPPRHCAESLYVIHKKKESKLYVSNSICFLIEKANIDIGSSDFNSIKNGLENSIESATKEGCDFANPVISETENIVFYRMTYYNFSVNSDFSIRQHFLPTKKYFETFTQYREFLISKTRAICENANSLSRKNAFSPITSISRGYDSPAAAVVASELGYLDAITIGVEVWNMDDCGETIGNKLGMNTEVVSHVMADEIADLNVDFDKEIKNISLEFIATAGAGDDVTFYPFREYLDQKIFLSGVYGDFVWEKDAPLTPGLPKRGIFGKSITEFRLNTGYFHLPIPALGARFSAPLMSLSNSREMQSFSVGGSYDRPIPRRLIEEAGIPREEFGVEKCATAPHILNRKELFDEAIAETRKRYVSTR